MNIIEAIQKAENGAMISKEPFLTMKRYFVYKGSGVFDLMRFDDNDMSPIKIQEVSSFGMGEIIATDWTEVSFFLDPTKEKND